MPAIMKSSSVNQSARVFFALWPETTESRQLAAWQVQLNRLCGGHAMRGKTLHNTLLFLGDVVLHRLEALQLAAREINVENFKLCFDEARYWRHNHIVYAAPAHVPQHLTSLVHALEQRLAAHHFKFDQRDYCPHVTLLRNAQWNDVPLPAMQPVCWTISDFALVQSICRNGLTDYKVLVRFPLSAG